VATRSTCASAAVHRAGVWKLPHLQPFYSAGLSSERAAGDEPQMSPDNRSPCALPFPFFSPHLIRPSSLLLLLLLLLFLFLSLSLSPTSHECTSRVYRHFRLCGYVYLAHVHLHTNQSLCLLSARTNQTMTMTMACQPHTLRSSWSGISRRQKHQGHMIVQNVVALQSAAALPRARLSLRTASLRR